MIYLFFRSNLFCLAIKLLASSKVSLSFLLEVGDFDRAGDADFFLVVAFFFAGGERDLVGLLALLDGCFLVGSGDLLFFLALPGFLPLFFGAAFALGLVAGDLERDLDLDLAFLAGCFLVGDLLVDLAGDLEVERVLVAGDLERDLDLDLAFLAGCFLVGDLLVDLAGDFEAPRVLVAGDFERDRDLDLAFLAGCFLVGDLLVDLAGDLEVVRVLVAGDFERAGDLLLEFDLAGDRPRVEGDLLVFLVGDLAFLTVFLVSASLAGDLPLSLERDLERLVSSTMYFFPSAIVSVSVFLALFGELPACSVAFRLGGINCDTNM